MATSNCPNAQKITVEVNTRPFGVRFASSSSYKSNVLQLGEVIEDSPGFRLGLQAGDVLSAINDVPIDHLSSTEALLLFRTQSLPFTVSFIRNVPDDEALKSSGFVFFDDIDATIDGLQSITPIDMISPAGSDQGPFAFVVQHSAEIPFSPIIRSNSTEKSTSSVPDDRGDYGDDVHQNGGDIVDGKERENSFSFNLENADSIPFDVDENDNGFNTLNVDDPDSSPFEFEMSPIEQTPIDLNKNGLSLRRLSCIPNHDSFTPEDDDNYLVSDRGFSEGIYEFDIQIGKCDVYRQEIGIVAYDENGNFGAKAIYGCELVSDSVYYASYDEGGKKRCYKDLVGKTMRKIGWTERDVITVKMDLDKYRIKFLLNGLCQEK